MVIYDVYCTGIAYDDVQLMSVICLKFMPQVEADGQLVVFRTGGTHVLALCWQC